MTKRKTRKQILYSEAAKLFVEKGYSATSIRGLAEKVGIEPSSIYSHIKSKEQLLVKICMDAAEYFVTGMEEIKHKDLPLFTTMDALIDLHLDAVREKPTTVTVFTDEWKHLPTNVLEEFINLRRGYEKDWEILIKKGVEEGTMNKVNPRIIAMTLLSSMRWIQTWENPDKKHAIEQLRMDLKIFIRRGLKKISDGGSAD